MELETTYQLRTITLPQLEKEIILDRIEFYRGDKVQAAKSLGIGKTTIYRKLKEYGK